MASVTRVEYTYKKPNTRYDGKIGKYIGYKIYVRVGGVRYREAGFATQKEAEDYIDDLRRKHKYSSNGLKAPAKKTSVSMKELVDARLDDLKRDPKRHVFVTRVLNYLLDLVGPTLRVNDLTYQHLKAFNKQRLSEKTNRDTPVTESTVDREMTEISSMLKAAGEYFDALEDYLPPKIPRLKLSDHRRTRTLSDTEMVSLVDYYARPRQPNESDSQYFDRVTIGHALEFAWLTSSRRKEVVRLNKKTDYFPDQDELRIVRWKTIKAKQRSVSIFKPIPRRVRELLELRMELDPKSEYFFSRDGKDHYGYLKSLKTACKRLGIQYGRFTDGGMIFHDTRHTFVTTLLENGVDLETARDLAGLSREMILRYAHATPQSKRNAVEIIDRKHDQREARKERKKAA